MCNMYPACYIKAKKMVLKNIVQAVSERLELQDVNVESSAHKTTVMRQGLCWGRTITSRVRSMGCISALGGGGQSIFWLSELLDSLTTCGKSSGFGFFKLPPDETNKRWTDNVTVSLSVQSLLAGSLVPVRNWAIFITHSRALLSKAEQLTYQTVIHQVTQILSMTHLKKLSHFHWLA